MAIFAVPSKSSHLSIPTQSSNSSSRTRTRSNKRKRLKHIHQDVDDDEDEDPSPKHDAANPSKNVPNLEYTAILSPLEKIQRRLAGHSFDQPIPPLPFPHAALRENETSRSRTIPDVKPIHASRSLHLQHLAALTAIIHRSILSQDYARAARAMGLMLRDDTVAGYAPIRNKGFMGIAAEILLRQDQGKESRNSDSSPPFHVSPIGLENAKRLYETLIIRHPYHKSWPESVNAIDFYLAMFNVWIHAVAVSEDNLDSPPSSPRFDQLDPQSLAKVRELDEANQIATRMDECMASVPYMDEPELIRLRAMVDLWLADLYETCYAFDLPLEQVSDSDSQDHPEQKDPTTDYVHLAQQSRERAQARLSKLEGQPISP